MWAGVFIRGKGSWYPTHHRAPRYARLTYSVYGGVILRRVAGSATAAAGSGTIAKLVARGGAPRSGLPVYCQLGPTMASLAGSGDTPHITD